MSVGVGWEITRDLVRDEIQGIIDEHMRREALRLEMEVWSFSMRTGLKPEELMVVRYKERAFIQWIGALPTCR